MVTDEIRHCLSGFLLRVVAAAGSTAGKRAAGQRGTVCASSVASAAGPPVVAAVQLSTE